MEQKKKTRTPRGRQVSVINWMGTLLVCSIPGVNLIALLCFAILGKSPSKRSFAIATLLWMLIALAAAVAALLAWPDQAAKLADTLRSMAAQTPQTVVP